MSALDEIKKKIEHNEPIDNIELAIFNGCLSTAFPETAEEAATELAQLRACIAKLERVEATPDGLCPDCKHPVLEHDDGNSKIIGCSHWHPVNGFCDCKRTQAAVTAALEDL